MKIIIDKRDTGKAHRLIQIAAETNSAILTQNKSAFEVKAHNYGYNNITIIDYEDLKNNNYDYGGNILIHNGDKVLEWIFDYFYGVNVKGFSATMEDNVE